MAAPQIFRQVGVVFLEQVSGRRTGAKDITGQALVHRVVKIDGESLVVLHELLSQTRAEKAEKKGVVQEKVLSGFYGQGETLNGACSLNGIDQRRRFRGGRKSAN